MSGPGAALDFAHRFVPANASTLTLLLLHGTGGSEDDLLPLGKMLAPRAALLAPRGKVLEHGMPRFFRRLAEGVFDAEDLRRRTHELADFVRSAAEAYRFDPRHVIAAGYSNGANIAASLLLLRPETLAGAVLLRAVLPLEPEAAPRLDGVRVLIAAGRRDPYAPAERVEALAALLRECGAAVELRASEAGHELTQGEIEAARDWIERFDGPPLT